VTTIYPSSIKEGESVTIQDEHKNVLQGPMTFTDEGEMALLAFKFEIPFARWSNRARNGFGDYVPIAGIKICGHQPSMDAVMDFDVVPRKHFKSNPT